MRFTGLVLLLLLVGCSGGLSALSPGQPGLNVAEAAMRGGAPQVALNVTDGLLQRHPGDVKARVVRGDALTALGRYQDAANDYTEALKRDSSSVGAHIGLGRLRLGSNPRAAEALFLEALQHDPRNTTALNDLGIARDLQGRHADAQQAYRQALGIDPDLRAAQVNLSLSLAMSGDSGRAEQLLRPLADNPAASRKLRHDLAAVLAMAGDRDAAARILSADLSPAEVRQALDAYASARSGGAPTPLLAGTASGVEAAAAPPPPPATSVAAQPVAPPPATRVATQAVAPPPATRVATQAVAPSPATGVAAQSLAPPPATSVAAQSLAPPRPAGAAEVQLVAAPSDQAARAEWQRLQQRIPDLLAGRQPQITRVEVNGQVFWRLRTGGFADEASASAFCQKVQAAGGACALAGR